jgi:hypothetical protein
MSKMVEGQVGVSLDMETGEYVPVLKVVGKVKPVTKKFKIKGSKKVAKKAVKKVVRESNGVKSDRHAEILKVIGALPAEYKRGDFLEKAVAVLGYSIPFNKKVREVYSVKQENGSYSSAK